ncbi:hypothetical protein CEXT_698061 [Caerostris extrusa]|uniref:Uncharacterized protein n=1 Tax=Caerostris extrusa TaxID=172846 RepID=A0AAV4UK98_CAEEX|nr:hypothetical protein CEXT_698061 [Caerostris extrusa]
MAQTPAAAKREVLFLFHPPVFLPPDNRQNVIHKRTATSEERDSRTGEVFPRFVKWLQRLNRYYFLLLSAIVEKKVLLRLTLRYSYHQETFAKASCSLAYAPFESWPGMAQATAAIKEGGSFFLVFPFQSSSILITDRMSFIKNSDIGVAWLKNWRSFSVISETVPRAVIIFYEVLSFRKRFR